jgi:tetratricopeptide (TPR) repeat protein
MRKCCMTVLFFFQLITPSVAQEQTKVDELKRLLRTAKEDTAKVRLLDNLATYYLFVAKDTALAYIQQQLLLSKRLNFQRGVVAAYSGLCYWHYLQSNYPRALEYGYKSLQLAEQGADSASLANCYNMLGHVNGGQKNYTQALAHYKKYFAMLPATARQESKALALSNIGAAFLRLN